MICVHEGPHHHSAFLGTIQHHSHRRAIRPPSLHTHSLYHQGASSDRLLGADGRVEKLGQLTMAGCCFMKIVFQSFCPTIAVSSLMPVIFPWFTSRSRTLSFLQANDSRICRTLLLPSFFQPYLFSSPFHIFSTPFSPQVAREYAPET